MNYNEETIFLDSLRKPGLRKSLDQMAAGLFADQKYPLDYAYGLIIGAGLTRCECGLWGERDELIKDSVPIPCPHDVEAETKVQIAEDLEEYKNMTLKGIIIPQAAKG